MAEFRIKRSLWLMRMQTMENWKIYGITLGIVAVINFCFSILTEDGSLITRFYPVILCLTGCFMAASSYHNWIHFGRASFYLLLPGSSGEKFIAVVIYCTLIFIPLFTIIYFFTAYIFLGLYHPMSFFEMISGGKESLLNYKTFYADTFLVYFLLLPFFLLGAARYRRYQFAATLLILSVVFVVYNYLQLFLLFNFSHGLAFGHTFFIRYGDFDYYLFPGGKFVVQKTDLIFRLKIMNTLAWLVIAAGLYITAFHSLKERQL